MKNKIFEPGLYECPNCKKQYQFTAGSAEELWNFDVFNIFSCSTYNPDIEDRNIPRCSCSKGTIGYKMTKVFSINSPMRITMNPVGKEIFESIYKCKRQIPGLKKIILGKEEYELLCLYCDERSGDKFGTTRLCKFITIYGICIEKEDIKSG